jgi:hypothetical protein
MCYFLCVLQVGRNVIHGSDSVENAQKEIALWFGGECRPLQLLVCLCCRTALRSALLVASTAVTL